jgi:hypothetical protein
MPVDRQPDPRSFHYRPPIIYRLRRVDLLELVEITKVQTPESAARQLYGTTDPSRAEVERARRRLEHLVAGGKIQKVMRPFRGSDVPQLQYVPLS